MTEIIVHSVLTIGIISREAGRPPFQVGCERFPYVGYQDVVERTFDLQLRRWTFQL